MTTLLAEWGRRCFNQDTQPWQPCHVFWCCTVLIAWCGKSRYHTKSWPLTYFTVQMLNVTATLDYVRAERRRNTFCTATTFLAVLSVPGLYVTSTTVLFQFSNTVSTGRYEYTSHHIRFCGWFHSDDCAVIRAMKHLLIRLHSYSGVSLIPCHSYCRSLKDSISFPAFVLNWNWGPYSQAG